MNQLLSRTFGQLQTTTNVLMQVVQSGVLSFMQVRTKKVKSGASARNRRRNTPGKYRRLFVNDGEWVEPDHLLVRQMGMQFYPGQNVCAFLSKPDFKTTLWLILNYLRIKVTFSADRSLKALYAGHVLITLEKLSPYPDSPLYPYTSAGNTVERKFIHVIPKERTGIYKLVEAI